MADNSEGNILVYSLEVVQDISVLEEDNLALVYIFLEVVKLDTWAAVDNLVENILEEVEEDNLMLGILAYIL